MEAPKKPDKCKHCAAAIPQYKAICEDAADHEDEVKHEDEGDHDVKIKQEDEHDAKVNVKHENEGEGEEDEHEEDEDDEDDGPVMCALCKEASYCSGKCETADFLSHRDSCKSKERVLAMQKQCFVCTTRIENDEEHCGACGRIKYCSAACKEADKKTHDLICGAYAELGPRPSKAHRICILFPAEEEKLRLIWAPTDDYTAIGSIVAPGSLHSEITVGPRVDTDDDAKKYRGIYFYHVSGFLFEPELAFNQSLGLATVGRPLKSVRGPLLIKVSECSDDDDSSDSSSDITPGDLPPSLHYFEQTEAVHGVGTFVHGYSRDADGNLVHKESMRFPLPKWMRERDNLDEDDEAIGSQSEGEDSGTDECHIM